MYQQSNNQADTLHLDNQTLLCDTEIRFQPVTVQQQSDTVRAGVFMPTYAISKYKREQKEPEGLTALYERLSQEDKADGESNSIATQKAILERYCRDRGYTAIRHYNDDGYSGTNFDRPGFQTMLADIKAGKIVRVVVKDMSRFGRDYLQVGMFTDVLFPQFGVHFVAVNDGVDSTRGDNEFTAIRNVFNEMYAKDNSKKLLAAFQNKGKAGEHLGPKPPYGYMKDPANKKKWIVDEEAAAVVQKIYALCVDGLGPTQIAEWLRNQRIPCPPAHWEARGEKLTSKIPADPCKWTTLCVSNILRRLDYLGHTVNFKTTKTSYKINRYTLNSPDDWMIFENTQEPIIEEETFMIVQNLREGRRRPSVSMGEPPMFSNLVYCTDCGGKMYYNRSRKNEKYNYIVKFLCSTYKNERMARAGCTAHYIRLDVLEEIVLQNLREAIAYVTRNEADFIREASDITVREQEREFSSKRNALKKAETRNAELDAIIKRLYEDNLSGKLTDERFIRLSRDYEREQSELKTVIETTRRELSAQEQKRTSVKSFIAITKKYTDLKELDGTVLREFVHHVRVSEKDKDTNEQKIHIVYNFVGAFDFTAATEQAATVTNTDRKDIA
jgi:DNA invertase Pin-like site-specific DNA recombinase